MAGNTRWRDISVPVRPGVTTFPGTPPVAVRRVSSLAEDGEPNVSALELSTHAATHVDAPVHFLEGGAGVEALDLDALNGPALVIDATGDGRVGAEALAAHRLAPGERVLLKTSNSRPEGPPWYEREFDPGYAHLALDGARHLVERRALLVGIDYLSIGGEGRDNPETHRALLGGGVTILEGLALEDVEPGRHELRCLPLLIPGGDGAPARAALAPAVR